MNSKNNAKQRRLLEGYQPTQKSPEEGGYPTTADGRIDLSKVKLPKGRSSIDRPKATDKGKKEDK